MVKDMYDYARKDNIDIIRCNRYDVYPNSNKIIERKPLWKEEHLVKKDNFKEEIYMDFLKRAKLGSVWMMLIKTEIIKKNEIKFDQNLKVDEDTIFSMQIFTKANNFLYLPKAYYFYVRHGQGLSARGIDLQERIDSRRKHAKLIKEYMKLWNINDEKILIEKVSFIGIYTAFQTCRINKKVNFYKRYKLFKSIIDNEIFLTNIKKCRYKNLLLHEKILCFLIKIRLYPLAFIFGMCSNILIDILRPIVEKFRN